MKILPQFIGLGLLMGVMAVGAWAAPIPQMINYQGAMVDTNGVPVEGTLSVTFSIWDDPVLVVPLSHRLWFETQPAVQVVDGLFDVLLGSVTPIPRAVFGNDSVWLQVQVGTNPRMTPRQRIASVAYAYHAWYADTAGFALVGGVSYARVFTVAEVGGDFTSVDSAIAAIPTPPGPPYLIRVMAGTYNEPAFTVPSNVTLRGAGRDCCFLIVQGGISMPNPFAMITGFDIQASIAAVGGIDITAQSITICDNNIMNTGGDGITISGDYKPIIHDNRIHYCQSWGVRALDGAAPFIYDNCIYENAVGGVEYADAGGSLSNNKISLNGQFGVSLTGNVSSDIILTIDDNQIADHPISGIFLGYLDSEPRVMGNEIRECGQYGIEVTLGNAHIVANTISRCDAAGIAVSGSNASAHILGNNIWNNQTYGIECSGGMVGFNSVVSSNIIILNGQDIWYPGAAAPPFTFNNNTFDTSPGWALGLYNVDSGGTAIAP